MDGAAALRAAFERLALPGFGRMGRYELLVTLGRLGLYELRADSLHLAADALRAGDLAISRRSPPSASSAIGDPLILERRALALAQELSVPIEVLDLALRQLELAPASARRSGSGRRDTLRRPRRARARR